MKELLLKKSQYTVPVRKHALCILDVVSPVAAGVLQPRRKTSLNFGAVNCGQAYSRGSELANVVPKMLGHDSEAPQSQDFVLMLRVHSEPLVLAPIYIEEEVAK
jgi:hypothetical protein